MYKTKFKDIEDKIPSITNLTANSSLNAKRNEIKNEIPIIKTLATTTGLTAVENKIPNVSNLVKKKQIIMQEKRILKINISPHLILINSLIINLM